MSTQVDGSTEIAHHRDEGRASAMLLVCSVTSAFSTSPPLRTCESLALAARPTPAPLLRGSHGLAARRQVAPLALPRVAAAARASAPRLCLGDGRLFTEDLNLIFDSKCGVCQWEVDFLRDRDTDGKLAFTDLEAEDFEVLNP